MASDAFRDLDGSGGTFDRYEDSADGSDESGVFSTNILLGAELDCVASLQCTSVADCDSREGLERKSRVVFRAAGNEWSGE